MTDVQTYRAEEIDTRIDAGRELHASPSLNRRPVSRRNDVRTQLRARRYRREILRPCTRRPTEQRKCKDEAASAPHLARLARQSASA